MLRYPKITTIIKNSLKENKKSGNQLCAEAGIAKSSFHSSMNSDIWDEEMLKKIDNIININANKLISEKLKKWPRIKAFTRRNIIKGIYIFIPLLMIAFLLFKSLPKIIP
jgi:hypothetical protein